MSAPRYDDPAFVAEVDAAMVTWRQGDVLRPAMFVHLADPARPGTARSQDAADKGATAGIKALRSTATGLVVISQTCDLVAKSTQDAPFVDCAALVQLPEIVAKTASAGDRPRYAQLPRLGDGWFADLDQVTTLEKAAVCHLARDRGVDGTAEQDEFGSAVGRKFARFAFPNDVHLSLSALQSKFKSRHAKQASPEGKALRAVQQIRVEAEPDWDSETFEAKLVFILVPGTLAPLDGDAEPAEVSSALVAWEAGKLRGPAEIAAKLTDVETPADATWLWEKLADAWAASCTPTGVLTSLTAEVTTSDEMKVSEYWQTQRLDLDYLSGPTPVD